MVSAGERTIFEDVRSRRSSKLCWTRTGMQARLRPAGFHRHRPRRQTCRNRIGRMAERRTDEDFDCARTEEGQLYERGEK